MTHTPAPWTLNEEMADALAALVEAAKRVGKNGHAAMCDGDALEKGVNADNSDLSVDARCECGLWSLTAGIAGAETVLQKAGITSQSTCEFCGLVDDHSTDCPIANR